jgi:hypothetical protein
MQKLVRLLKLNNLEYNPNRDPQFYRRTPGQEFRLQALLGGSGAAKARLVVEGRSLCEEKVAMPGTFECRFSFPSPGSRIATLTIEANGTLFRRDIRLDVEEQWIG